MEIPPFFGVLGLVMVLLYYLGLDLAITWMLHRKTRPFGLAFAISLLLTVLVYSSIMNILFTRGVIPYNHLFSLVIGLGLSITLAVMQYKDLSKRGEALFGAEFKENRNKGIWLSIAVVIVLSLITRLWSDL